MGIRKELKKATKQIGHALADPLNAVNMLNSAYSLGKNIEQDHQKSKQEQKNKALVLQQAEENTAEQNFQEELDHKRRLSKRTNVIFAGLLGNNDQIGLGGQKNLLGL